MLGAFNQVLSDAVFWKDLKDEQNVARLGHSVDPVHPVKNPSVMVLSGASGAG